MLSRKEGRLSDVDATTRDRAARVRLILLDVDGVLTDGSIHLAPGGADGRSFYVRDGLAIRLGQRAGLTFGIVSGRATPVVDERAAELDITEVHQREHDKAGRLREIGERLGVPASAVCFIGDDLIDVPAMRGAGFAAAPADASAEAIESAHYVTRCAGGRGAVREVIELVLRASGKWDEVTASFRPKL
jgi:3-deoxy-D-manno-octulosonate 8-phosphate phosphatase (KDO 8-P phosphatase)